MSTIKKNNNITGVVLGGGHSRRMGRDKRNLKWDGVKFLDRVCLIMGDLFDEVLLVTAREDYPCCHLPVRLVTDAIPHKGSIGGLYTGLKEASLPYVFVVACDMPLLNPLAISHMCGVPDFDVVMVKLSTGVQPLHGRYSKRCCPVIERMIFEGELRIQNLIFNPTLSVQLIEESEIENIDPRLFSFFNINTPADYEFAKRFTSGMQ